MSDMAHYTGKIKPVNIEELAGKTLEEQCEWVVKSHGFTELHNYCDSWEEMIADEFYHKYVIYNATLYEVISYKREDSYGDVFSAHKNLDGSIDFEVLYYDGGCSFDEAIGEALDKMEKFNV